jgi:ABC-type branched-subunit amino acid transport system substrate-binding protein
VLLAASACSTKANNAGGSGGTAKGGIKTGPGVTASTITLGDLTDLHGVFAALGKSITNANKLYWDQVNKSGGICGRQVNIVVKDHGYDVQQALPLYQQLRGSVLSLQQALGSPINTALLNNYTADKMLTIPSAWASTLLANQYIMNVGSTYDFEMINLVDWALEKKMIQPGDKIGHIYFEGEYGSNGLTGSKFAASKNNLTVIEEKIKATDQDVSAQVADLKSKGAKAILLTAGPLQSASAAAAAEASGYNVPILSQNPGFSPGLMATAAATALEKHFYIVVPWLQPSSDNAEVSKAISEYKSEFPGAQIDGGITWGYGAADAYRQVLQKACDDKDLTRQGIYNAFRSLSSVDTKGIFPVFDYTKIGDAATHEAYIWRASKSAPGALVAASDGLYKGKDVDSYKAPAAKG